MLESVKNMNTKIVNNNEFLINTKHCSIISSKFSLLLQVLENSFYVANLLTVKFFLQEVSRKNFAISHCLSSFREPYSFFSSIVFHPLKSEPSSQGLRVSKERLIFVIKSNASATTAIVSLFFAIVLLSIHICSVAHDLMVLFFFSLVCLFCLFFISLHQTTLWKWQVTKYLT